MRRTTLIVVLFFFLNACGLGLISYQLMQLDREPGRLVVVNQAPSGSGISEDTDRITLEFGAFLDPNTVTEDALRFLPAVKGRTELREGRFLVCQLEEPLSPATRYQLQLNPALRGVRGEVPPQELLSFATTPLRVVSVEQVDAGGEETFVEFAFTSTVDPRVLLREVRGVWPDGRPVDWRLCGEVPSRRVVLQIPTLKWERLSVTLPEGLTSTEGPLGLGSEYAAELPLSDRLVIRRVEADYYGGRPCIEIETNTSVDPGEASRITIKPALGTHVDSMYDGLRVFGDFEAGKRYEVTVRAGLAGHDGMRPLADTLTRAVWFGDKPAQVSIPYGGGYLPDTLPLKVPLRTVNLERVDLTVQRLYPNAILDYVLSQDGAIPGMRGPRAVQREVKVVSEKNHEVETVLDLGSYAEGPVRGVYGVEARDPDRYWTQERAVFVVSDLGLSLQAGRREALAWVASLSTAEARSGVTLRLYSDRRKLVAEGVTGEDGTARLSLASLPEEERLAVLIAEAGEDVSYLNLSRTQRDAGDVSVAGGGWPETYQGMVFAERGVYREGETVHLRALVKDRAWKAAPSMPMQIELVRPDGRVLATRPVMCEEGGVVQASWEVPGAVPQGMYTARLGLPGGGGVDRRMYLPRRRLPAAAVGDDPVGR